jgi:polyisoprenoid-binding protein YceI
MFKKVLIVGLALAVSGSAWAGWKVDNDYSRVNFVSVKKNKVGEAHHFTKVMGTLSDKGELSVEIPLASVETSIPIRNERMQKLLFETDMFPKAHISAQINPKYLNLKTGESTIITVDADVGLHGVNKIVKVEVLVSKLGSRKILVSSLKPIVIKPADYGLAKGVDKLMAVANLPGITQAVPVSFILTFEK